MSLLKDEVKITLLLIGVPTNVIILALLLYSVWPILMALPVYPGHIGLLKLTLCALAYCYVPTGDVNTGAINKWYSKMIERLGFNSLVSLLMVILWILS